jgi:hypothetical protein
VSFPGYGGKYAEPAPADYDNDHRLDFAVREQSGWWRIDFAGNGIGRGWDVAYPGFGGYGWHPVPGDYDGDKQVDLALKSDTGRWAIDFARNGFGAIDRTIGYAGGITARPVPADYDNDGTMDLAVRVDCGPWFIDYGNDGYGTWNRRYDHMSARDVATVTEASEFVNKLQSDFTGTIFVPSGAEFRLNEYRLTVKSCVSIRGTRQGLEPGSLIHDEYDFMKEGGPLLAVTGHDVRIQGLRLQGPSGGRRTSEQPVVKGIEVTVDPSLGLGGNVVIEGNEMWDWPAAVAVRAKVETEDPER